MSRSPHKLLSALLSAALFISAVATTPDTVLCMGPGHHCHLETMLGAGCNDSLQDPGFSTHQLPDGCPKGSKDFRLSVVTHRSDGRALLASDAVHLKTSARSDTVAGFSRAHVTISRLTRSLQSPPNTVLRC